jgi:hypothetical protein
MRLKCWNLCKPNFHATRYCFFYLIDRCSGWIRRAASVLDWTKFNIWFYQWVGLDWFVQSKVCMYINLALLVTSCRCAISVLHHAAVLFQFYIMPLCYFSFTSCRWAISVLHHAAVLFQSYIMPLCYFSFTSCRCAISVLHHAAVLFQSKYIDCKTVCGALTNSI